MVDKLPKATHEGTLHIGDAAIPAAVLDNGQRVLTQSGFMRALGRARQAKGRQYYDSDVNMPAFLTAKNLKPYVSNELEVTSTQIEFQRVKGGRAFGYPAELLPKVCGVFLDAEEAGVLAHNQKHIAAKAHILIRGLAHVGITALVDEATGYQDIRARKALEEILDKFITEELKKWAKTFPDEFYKEMFRLRGWSYIPWSVKRPSAVGKYTNDLVYQRLAPGVLQELKRRNPTDEKGRRRVRHHQWLTEDVGHPRLREHLAAVIALMKASTSWEQFRRSLQRALPKFGTNLELPLNGENNDKAA